MMKFSACVWPRGGRSSRRVMALLVVCIMTTVFGCATLDLEMKQDVTQAPPCQAGCTTVCDPCPPVICPGDCRNAQAYASLVIEDPDLAAWSVLNDTFTYDDPGQGDAWYGFMIQLGRYEYPGDIFKYIKIDTHDFCLPGSGWCAQLGDLQEVKWINIVPARVTPRPPMALEDLDQILPPPDDRALHATFEAKAVITYWMGERGYDVWVTGRRYHPIQTFSFNDEVDVEVYLISGEKLEYQNVKSIQVFADPGGNHGSYHDPPMGKRP